MLVKLDTIAWSFPISFNTLTVRGNDSLKKTTFLYRNTFFYVNPLLLFIPFIMGIVLFIKKKREKNENTIIIQKEEIISSDRAKRIRRIKK